MLNYLIDFGCGVLSILIIFAMICHAMIKTLRRGVRRSEMALASIFSVLLFITVEYSLKGSEDILIGTGITMLWIAYLIGLIIFSKYNK